MGVIGGLPTQIYKEPVVVGDVVLALVDKVIAIAVEMLKSGRRLAQANCIIPAC